MWNIGDMGNMQGIYTFTYISTGFASAAGPPPQGLGLDAHWRPVKVAVVSECTYFRTLGCFGPHCVLFLLTPLRQQLGLIFALPFAVVSGPWAVSFSAALAFAPGAVLMLSVAFSWWAGLLRPCYRSKNRVPRIPLGGRPPFTQGPSSRLRMHA